MRNLVSQDELVERLGQTVPTLDGLTAGLDHERWHLRPVPEEWSLTEIVCHLRDVDREVHLPRLRSMIDTEEPFMPGVASDDWAKQRDYQVQDGPQALAQLAAARSDLLSLLPAPGDAIWERRGRHTFFGPTTFWELVCLVLEHDQLHIEQAGATATAGIRRLTPNTE